MCAEFIVHCKAQTLFLLFSVTLISVDYTPRHCVILYLQTSIRREIRSVPNLIYAIEQLEKFLIKLDKKAKVTVSLEEWCVFCGIIHFCIHRSILWSHLSAALHETFESTLNLLMSVLKKMKKRVMVALTRKMVLHQKLKE